LVNFFKVISKGKIQNPYYFKTILTFLIVFITIPFRWWEKIFFYQKLRDFKFEKPPVFILGHWRSGTTFLHNTLCKDPDAAYVTTYHSVFPNNLASKLIFKTFQKAFMPDKRPADNVKLRINNPQEDEFALINMIDNTFYTLFFFPEEYHRFFKEAIEFNISKDEELRWNQKYDELVKKAVINTKGKRVIIKNPANTGRIPKLMEMYPDAKFIYIHRNPIIVFLSTRRFFTELFPTLWFHKVDESFIEKMIIDNYKKLLGRYEDTKSLLSEDNLLEIRFDDYDKNPVELTRLIYEQLFKEDFDKVEKIISQYVSSLQSYKKSKNYIEKGTLDLILKEFGPYMKLYNYDIPDNLEII
jgi:hypothetical protein